MTSKRTVSTNGVQIDLVELLRIVWRYKGLVIAVASGVVLIAVLLALFMTPVYRAEVVVTPAREPETGGAGALASQFGGLASMAGITLPQSGGPNHEARAILESRQLVEEFIRRNDLLPTLFPQAKKKPTLWLAVKYFQEDVFSLRDDAKKGTTTVAVEWTDPVVAAKWANGLVALVNEMVRNRALSESGRNLAYLKEQLTRTNLIELQRVIYELIGNETKTLMLANGRTEYAFSVVDPAVAPELRIRPKRTLIVIAGAIVGLLLGTMAALVFNSLRESRHEVGRNAEHAAQDLSA